MANAGGETARLLDAHLKGDRAALERLLEIYRPHLQLYVRARLGRDLRRRVDSQDVLQETYLEAIRAIGQFSDPRPQGFRAWLTAMAENRIRWLFARHIGAARRNAKQELPLGPDAGGRASPTASPVTRVLAAERVERLLEVLDELPDDDRLVLILRFLRGMTSEEAAGEMGRTPAMVRKITARALARLGSHAEALQGLQDIP
jgi:RNA polymerase sigma-70 factor (ECF subfamily)